MGDRLYDRIVHRGVLPEVVGRLFTPKTPVIVANNVAKWYFDGVIQREEWWDETDDFSNVVPPFDLLFVEAKVPPKISHVAAVDDPDAAHLDMVGFLFETYNLADIERAPFAPRDLLMAVHSGVDTMFVTRVHIFVEGPQFAGGDPMHVWTWMYPFTRDGRINPDADMTKGKGILIGGPSAVSQMDKDAAVVARQSFHSLLFVGLLAINFAHSPLVEVAKLPYRDMTKINKKRAPKAAENYYKLEIDPLVKFLNETGKAQEVGHRQAFRACRDHFRQAYAEAENGGQVSTGSGGSGATEEAPGDQGGAGDQ